MKGFKSQIVGNHHSTTSCSLANLCFHFNCNITHVGLPRSKVAHPTGVGNGGGDTQIATTDKLSKTLPCKTSIKRQSANFAFLSSWNLNSSITAVRPVNSWHIMYQHMRYWYKNHFKRSHMKRFVVLNETNQLL